MGESCDGEEEPLPTNQLVQRLREARKGGCGGGGRWGGGHVEV